jgi:hypothetical protein
MNLISKYAAAALLTLTGVAIAMPAKAIPTLRLTQNANVILVEDNDANDVNSLAGVVSFAGPVGDYLLTSSVGITKPTLGTANQPSIDLLSVQLSSSVASSVIEVAFSDTDFSTAGPSISLPSLIGGTTNGTIRYQTFASLTNTAFATDILISDSGVLGSGAFAFTDYATIALQGLYSLTTIVTVTHGANLVNSSFNATVEISEPALISMTTLSGLLFIAGFGANRRQRRR